MVRRYVDVVDSSWVVESKKKKKKSVDVDDDVVGGWVIESRYKRLCDVEGKSRVDPANASTRQQTIFSWGKENDRLCWRWSFKHLKSLKLLFPTLSREKTDTAIGQWRVRSTLHKCLEFYFSFSILQKFVNFSFKLELSSSLKLLLLLLYTCFLIGKTTRTKKMVGECIKERKKERKKKKGKCNKKQMNKTRRSSICHRRPRRTSHVPFRSVPFLSCGN